MPPRKPRSSNRVPIPTSTANPRPAFSVKSSSNRMRKPSLSPERHTPHSARAVQIARLFATLGEFAPASLLLGWPALQKRPSVEDSHSASPVAFPNGPWGRGFSPQAFRPVPMTTFSRSHFLRLLAAGTAASGAKLVLAPSLAARALLARGPADRGSPLFEELPPSATGITWRHVNGRSAEYYLPETTGAGCAFLDYDNDGWMDIYLVNSGKCDFFSPDPPLRNALYKNNRDGTFTDVTEKAGVPGGGYGMGVAVGDYNGDGYPDLFVTQYERCILYRNNGDGTFTDVTEKAGVGVVGWASSAVWFDYDNDGKLDLFVCRFVDFSKEKHHHCGAPNIPALAGQNEYCYPRIYTPMPSWLFHNNGDGTFTDVSQKMGITDNPGKSWGVVATDINNDGWLDLFVANDTEANFLFANRQGKRFEEIGFTAGVAYSEGGKARSGMGVDSADLNQDGWMDLFVTNLNDEFYALYQNGRDESFEDRAAPAGVARASQMMSGWGLKFFDFDNDGL